MMPTAARPRTGRALLRVGAVLAVLLTALLGLAGPAAAHNVLISSNPTDGSTLDAAPQTVTLTFDQPVQDFEPVVVVTGPDGAEYQSGTPVIAGTGVEMALAGLPVAGAYTVAYRIVSTDGHPVQGQLVFQLSDAAVAPAPSSAAATSAETTFTEATSAAESSAAESSAATSSAAASTPGSSTPTSSSAAPSSAVSNSPTAAPTSAAVATTPPTSSAAVTPAATSGGLSGWIWAALVVAALLVVAAVVVIVRRPRRT